NVTVYDEVTGRTQTFGNIPIGITTMAGMTNLIEKGIAGIVTTAGGSSYISGAGGIGYEAVIQVIASGISTQQQSVDMTLSRYIQDCLFFELARPGTTLKIQDIRNGTTDLMTALAQSVNPAAYTVVYLNKPEGETKTCTDAWNMLSPKLNDPNFFDENIVKAACNSAGFDSSNPLEFSACTTTLGYTLQQIAKGNPLSYNDFARKAYIALNIEDFVKKNGAVPLSNYYIGQQGSTTALVLNQWIPIIKANLTALILCLTPFLLIFLPTPLASRVVAMIAGFFIWITMWGIADAITHEIIVTQASNIFEKVRNNKWGYDAIMFLPDSLSRSLSLFGYIRSAGMTLATIMTTMLVKFGGTALAMYAGSITSTVSSSAARGSHEALTPHGSANTIMENSSAPGKLESAGLTSFTERALASKGNTMRSIYSGVAFEKATQNYGQATVRSAIENLTAAEIGTGAGFGNMGTAFNTRAVQSQGQVGQAQMDTLIANTLFNGDVRAYHAWRAGGGYLAGELARRFEKSAGFKEGTLEGLRADPQSLAFDDRGRLASAAFTRQDSKGGIRVENGQIINMGVDSEGFAYQKTMDFNGNVVNYVGRKVLGTGKTFQDSKGNNVSAGPGTDVSKFGEGDGAIYHYRGYINGGQGELWTDSKGNIIYSKGVKGIENSDVGVTGEKLQTSNMGEIEFSGKKTTTSSGITVLDGAFKTPHGEFSGTAMLRDGRLIKLDAEKGMDLTEIDRVRQYKSLSRNDLVAIRDKLKETSPGVASNIDRTIQQMDKLGLKQADVDISFKPGSKPGEFATINVKSGNNDIVQNFTLGQKGWENMEKALDVVDKGRRVADYDSYKHIPKGFADVTIYNPKTGEIEKGIAQKTPEG
ncbi:MAG: conjugal transfer protein TraG N-terminal domain-containing protein, partial [Candidatus Aenigmatarchaeota archaeon]